MLNDGGAEPRPRRSAQPARAPLVSDTTAVADRLARPLRRGDLDQDPVTQFRTWFDAARDAGVPMPEAVSLATATPDGRPSVRMVLLKGVDDRGFSFYTSYGSRKGRELRSNPHGALAFYWHDLGRQVRVDGPVGELRPEESDAYFASRPYLSQLSASVSVQSEVVANREELETAVAELRTRSAEGQVPRPESWGGFVLAPESFEFWQHREDRLHDRFRYSREATGWMVERLAP